MDLYKRQQFEFLLQTAVERLTERLEQRHSGCECALKLLEGGQCAGEVSDFVAALFQDFLLDNADGACFILRALAQRRIDASMTLVNEQTVECVLTNLARQLFQNLLIMKTRELLEQHSRYQPLEVGGASL